MKGYIVCFILFFVIFMIQESRKKVIRHLLKIKFGGNEKMEEIIKSYIDKDVELTLIENGVVFGLIKKYCDGWLILEDENKLENSINCNYIVEIKPSKYAENLRIRKEKKLEKERNKANGIK